MGDLNTFFNYRSAVHNAATAANTAATAKASETLASSDRRRVLHERGLITHSSTPAEIAAVEHRLDAQMRARILLEGSAPRRHPYALPIAVAVSLVVVGLFMAATGHGETVAWLALVVAVLVGCVIAALRTKRREDHRARVLARATPLRGACGWCGEHAEHVIEGEKAHPLVFHAVEVEAAIAKGAR